MNTYASQARIATVAPVGDDERQRFLDEMQWVRENRALYAGRWVALVGKTLLAEGASAREVFEASRGSDAVPLIHLVENETLPFAGW